jgi:hypothetical protein
MKQSLPQQHPCNPKLFNPDVLGKMNRPLKFRRDVQNNAVECSVQLSGRCIDFNKRKRNYLIQNSFSSIFYKCTDFFFRADSMQMFSQDSLFH